MRIFWSPSSGSFFDEAVHGERLVLMRDDHDDANSLEWVDNPDCVIPADAIEVSSEDHQTLMSEVSQGKRLLSDEHGRPIAVEPSQTLEEAVAALKRRRDRDLAASDWTQLPDALTAAKRKLWKEHRQALRDLPKLVEAELAAGRTIAEIAYPEPPA
jgi:hypothetical protein